MTRPFKIEGSFDATEEPPGPRIRSISVAAATEPSASAGSKARLQERNITLTWRPPTGREIVQGSFSKKQCVIQR